MIIRIILAGALVAYLGGCGPVASISESTAAPYPVDAGWHYSWNQGAPKVIYGFGPPDMFFVGRCDAGPIFVLSGGTYASDARKFTLIADTKVRQFDAYQGEHGRGLLLLPDLQQTAGRSFESRDAWLTEGRIIAQEIASARAPIVIRTEDGWTKTIPPNSAVERFVRECIAFRNREAERTRERPTKNARTALL